MKIKRSLGVSRHFMPTKAKVLVLGLGLSLAAHRSAHAATVRVWNNTGTDFNAAGSYMNAAPVTGDTVNFSTAEVTQPNVTANISLAEVEFNATTASGYDLTSTGGFTLTLTSVATGSGGALYGANTSGTNTVDAPIFLGGAASSTQNFTQATGGTLVVNGAISGNSGVGLLFTTGTFTLTGANTYSGNTTITGSNALVSVSSIGSTGTAAAAGALGEGASVIFISGGLKYTGGGETSNKGITFAKTANGATDTLDTTSATGNLTLSGAITTSTASTGQTLVLTGNTTTSNTLSGNLTDGTGTLGLTVSSGQWTLSGTGNTYSAGTTLSGGLLTVGNSTALGTGALAFTGGSLSASTAVTLGNAVTASSGAISTISGSNSITFGGTEGGAYSHTLTNNLATSATFTLSGGVVLVPTATATNYATTFNGTGNTLINSTISGSSTTGDGSLIYAGTGTLTLSAANTYTGTTTVSSGALDITGSGTLGATTSTLAVGAGTLDLGTTSQTVGAVTLTGAGTIQNGTLTGASYGVSNASGTATISAALGNSAAVLTKGGAGTLVLSNSANAYTGGTTISAGTLQFTTGALSTTGTISLATAATLQYGANTTDDISGRLYENGNGVGHVVNFGANSVNFASAIGASSSNQTNDFTGTSSSDVLTLSGTTNLYSGTTPSSTNFDTITVKPAKSTANQLAGAYTLTNGATLSFASAGSVNQFLTGNSKSVINLNSGTTVDLAGSTQSVSAVQGTGGTITNSGSAASTLSLVQASNAGTVNAFGGIIQDGSSVGTTAIVITSTAVTFSGANTYSGGTSLTQGTFNIGNLGTTAAASAIGTGALTIGGSTVIDNLSGASGTLSTNNAVNVNGSFTFTGTNSLNFGTGNVTLGATPVVTVTANTLGISGNISGAFGLSKAGAGTLSLSGANSYTGATAVSAGTISVDSAGSTTARLASTSGITISGTGMLALVNSSATPSIDRLNNSATVTLSGGTLNLGGLSEGAAGTTGVGALTLTANSTLDYGTTGTSNVIQFSGLGTHTASTVLAVTEYESGTDHLYFAGTVSSFTTLYPQATVSFDGTSGYTTVQDSGYYEIVGITAVPEPSTMFAGLLACGALSFHQRRRVGEWLRCRRQRAA